MTTWEPREIVAYLVGREAMANGRIPRIVAGMPSAELNDPTQATTMNDAIDTAFITLMGEQSLETLCSMLRQTMVNCRRRWRTVSFSQANMCTSGRRP